MTQLSNDANVIAQEINELAEHLGRTAWKLGRLILGNDATAKQIANYLSQHDFGIPGSFPPSMILNFMMRVKHHELS